MRLHLLEITAIGPFATTQSVDFDELSSSGLFLLDGPTGAGKTTVLDAITFALYGPGDRGGDGRLHSDFAAAGVEPQVRLEFSMRGVRHRVTRSPEYERPKLRGGGTTKQAAQAHLERFEGDRWVSRSSNKAEIGLMLADEIGLTRDQFGQVVLLPQGEFARFLRSTDDERRELLTRLFGTQLYDHITDELDRRRGMAARELDGSAGRVSSGVAAAAEAAGLDPAQRDELCAAPADERRAQLSEFAAALSAREAGAGVAAERTAHECAMARVRASTSAAAVDRLRRAAVLRAAADAHEQGRPAHERRRQLLAAASGAEPVRPLVEIVRETTAALAAARAAVDARADLPSWDSEELVALAEQQRREAAELQHLVELEQGLPALGVEARATQTAAGTTRDERLAIELRIAALPHAIELASAAARAASDAAGQLPALETRVAGLAAKVAAARTLAALDTGRSAAAQAAELAIDRHQQAVDSYQTLVERRLGGMAAELAGRLVDGEPCEVCGSRVHPSAATPGQDAVTAADIAAAEAARATADRGRRAAEQGLADLDRQLAAARAIADGTEVDELRAQHEAAVEELEAATREAAEALNLRARHEKLIVDEQRQRTSLLRAVELDSAAVASAAAAKRHYDDTQARVRAAAGTAESVAARQRELQHGAATCAAAADQIRAAVQAAEAAGSAAARAEAVACDLGFGSVDEAAAAVLPRERQAMLAAEIAAWDDQAARYHSELALLGDGLESARGGRARDELAPLVVAAEAAAAEADAGLQAAEAMARAAEGAAEQARHAVRRFAERCADLETAERAHDALAAELEPVLHLARLAKGMGGRRRVALTTFVLRHWFEHVVQAANIRLAAISAGRYELVRVDEGATKTERAGLTLQVVDQHTGEARSPRSLSGGETFYTSLALALGLADVVRAEAGGVDLDTLFIDEGFGTLDADTLEQVMTVIDDLRDRGRTVGIVSHVADLKERIPERLEVRRLADGSSALRVVA
ncbi:MAG: repair protein SbcC/Rad50 [Pseudonocardiales bacterium]|nr:repair protein SbcC/Rad50 [Pseudonocardiales bacterium]